MTHPETAAGPSSRLTPALVACVFLPFAGGFFLSYIYRTINAVIAPDIAADTGLMAADIGLLTSMYFLAFAAFQLPLGMLLDRFGPGRVEAALLMVAALGAVIFGLSSGLAGLALGRALIGMGVSCCLMASFKAFAQWFPSERLPLVNGCLMTFGGLGALASTTPVELLLQITNWHILFFGLGAATALAAATVFLIVPEHPEPVSETRFHEQLIGLGHVFRDKFFWRITPTAAITIGVSLSVQSLWAGPWLHDVQNLDRLAVASHLMVAAATLGLGYPLIGMLAQRLSRLGVATATVSGIGMTGFMIVIALMASGTTGFAWSIMGTFGLLAASSSLCYAVLGQHFPPRLVGRANTGMNLLVFVVAFTMQWGLGAIIGHWVDPATGRYTAEGYRIGFGLLAGLQTLALLWFFVVARRFE